MYQEIERVVQVALLGEVPLTLRFLYVNPDSENICFHAVFASDATDEHMECAEVVCTEMDAKYALNNKWRVIIERNDHLPWKKGNDEFLMYFRWGELDNT